MSHIFSNKNSVEKVMSECVGFVKDLANTHWVIAALAVQQVIPGKIVRTLGYYTSSEERGPTHDYWSVSFKRDSDNHVMEVRISARLAALIEREESEPFGAPFSRISCEAEDDANILVETLIAMLGGGKIGGRRAKQWETLPPLADQSWVENISEERAFAIRVVDSLGSDGLNLLNKTKIDTKTLQQLKSVVAAVAPLRFDVRGSKIYEEVQ
jgi:hypothetical protein